MNRLRVLMTTEEIVPERLAGATAVVLDVFMATTTLVTILENGARRVLPVASLEQAEKVCAGLDADALLRGGEQNARPIDGWDCGPYPDEYTPERVRDRDVVFLTTNGTRAIGQLAGAARLLVASLRNAPATARYLEATEHPAGIYLICAGSKGCFALEDFYGAATILSHMDVGHWRLNDAAWLALDFAERFGDRPEDALRNGRAGRWFIDHDRVDAFRFVTEIGASEQVAEVRDGQLLAAADAHTNASV